MMIPIIGALIGAISTGVSDWQKRKKATAKAKHEVKLAKLDAKKSRFEAEAKLEHKRLDQEADYDMQVLKNRENSFADEIIIAVWMVIFIAHFIPALQPYMAGGWKAMGYENGPPWWFGFGMVGILVSTLGLMKMLRIWFGRFGANRSTDSRTKRKPFRIDEPRFPEDG
jgi:hypothetical protein